jgi:hypothetical protein
MVPLTQEGRHPAYHLTCGLPEGGYQMAGVSGLLRRHAARVRAGFVLFVLGKAAQVGGTSLGGALPAVVAAVATALQVAALVMVWTGLEGFMAGAVAGFEQGQEEKPP